VLIFWDHQQKLLAVNTTNSVRRNVTPGYCVFSGRMIDEIQIHVIGWRRPHATRSLLELLEKSDYSGWNAPIPLYIHLDGGALQEVITISEELHWTHGEKQLDMRLENVGLREMWLSSLTSAASAAGGNTLMVVFEDDMTLSLNYFQWILVVIDNYGASPDCRHPSLMGFSLSPIRLQEMSLPFTRWDARDTIGHDVAYLSVLPSSWGAAYWSDRWIEFADFAKVRMRSPFYNIHDEGVSGANYRDLRLGPKEFFVPGAQSNHWPKSWKRFMVEWMYGRGLVMLYPNLPGGKGVATTALPGEHVGKSSSPNPRVSEVEESIDFQELSFLLPEFKELSVVGLNLQPTTLVGLAVSGVEFLRGVREKCSKCGDLLRVWARVLKQGSPSICVPDLFSQESLFSKNGTDLPKSTQRYLLYEPQYGGNNQIYALAEAMKWATLLDRQLVLPPLFLPRVREFSEEIDDWPVTEKYLKVNDPAGKLTLIGFREWLKLNIPYHHILRISRNAIFDEKSMILTNTALREYLPTETVETVDLFELFADGRTSYDTAKTLFGGCEDVVLAFDGMFFMNMNSGLYENNYARLERITQYSDELRETHHTVKSRLRQMFGKENYTCYHVRLGDFISMCDEVSNAQDPRYEYWTKMMRKGYKCLVTEEDLLSTILSDGRPALILSNTAFDTLGTMQKLPLATASSEWLQQLIAAIAPSGTKKAELDVMSLLIEQQLCADADFAWLNIFSSFSQRIASMRDINGRRLAYWR